MSRRFASSATLTKIPAFLLIAALISVGLFVPGITRIVPAYAATLIVTSNADSGANTLRAAITNANPGDTITFNLPSGSNTITLTTGELAISKSLAIDGSNNGNGITLSGNNASRIFDVKSSTANVTLSNLTIEDGTCGTGQGGGIANSGTLTINDSTLSNNSSLGQGGGLANSGTLTISNSTISGNSALGNGGGVFNHGTLTISSSTLSGNSADSGYSGGGVYNVSGSSTLNLFSSIVAKNTGTPSDIQGTVNSLGYNLIGDGTGSTGLTNGVNSDQVGTSASPIDPLLGALANNGGGTQTMALLNGSPAIGAGDCTGNTTANPPAPAVTIDQRGVARGTPCDIGAYEASVNPTPTPTSTSSATFTPSSTSTNTSTVTATSTATITPSSTPTNTATSTITLTPTNSATSTSTATVTNTPPPGHIDTIGVDRSNTFYLRLHNSTGAADSSALFNIAGRNVPIVGDWGGAGFDAIGVLDQNTGNFTLCTGNTSSVCSSNANQILLSFTFGNPNDTPLSGRWTSTATHAGVGVYRPTNGILYAKNDLTTGFSDYSLVLGNPGDQGIAGDWIGIGQDGLGVFRPGNLNFYLVNRVMGNGIVYSDENFQFGGSTDVAIAGDWIGQGHDGVGVFRPSNATVYLKNALTSGSSDNSFAYGASGDLPIAGHWQVTYPPIVPNGGNGGSVPGGNQIGG